MYKLLISLLLGIAPIAMQAETPRWLRNCAISPDGTAVAFCYKGDIYTVSPQGGNATRLTTNAAYDTKPVWSPDSRRIAFSSDREGSLDIFVMDRDGGIPTRLTVAPGKETPVAWKDNNTVLFLSAQLPSTSDMQFPGSFSQVYEIKAEAQARPRQVVSMPMESISISADGTTWLYNDFKGYEDPFRKHHTSSITRDIWSWTPSTNKYTKLTSFKGEDRDPVWGANGSLYYLSEETGTFNVHKLTGAVSTPLTHFEKDPVRFLSRATDGTLCFSQNGDIYTLKWRRAKETCDKRQ